MKLKESDNAKPTENLEQLLARFTKRIAQIKGQEQTDKTAEQLHYLRGCKETIEYLMTCLLYTSPSPRDKRQSRMPSSA